MNEPGTEIIRRQEQSLPSPISRDQAMYLLRTIWPGAPESDIVKAGILCRQYGLNPLMRQVYLIKFDRFAGRGAERRKVGEEWAIVLGIKASRQIAQQAVRKHGCSYGYTDGPRKMTEQEEIAIYGEVDPSLFRAIVLLKDNHGNIYQGYGAWPREAVVYGAEKGNSQANMAFIRAERNALDKLAPGELPDLDVGDDAYIVGDYKAALEKGQQEFDKHVDEEVDLLYGEDPKKPGEIKAEGSKPPVGTVKPIENDSGAILPVPKVNMDDLKQSLSDSQWPPVDVLKYLFHKFKVTGKTGWDAVLKLNPEQLYEFAQEVERRRSGRLKEGDGK